ncbi:MAG TPA: Grx4 family monothiol glutaredoxin [Xanthomonadales bacterium]|nr:Grx4 family monothiol glutaredoxin [Xanthomonadales bacterium]
MNLNDAVREKIERQVKGNKVVLFMKGTPRQPMCGFSARTVAALDSVWPDYASVNVLEDEEIREGIKLYGNWPTIPQLYINGELIGGCDIILGMLNSGELHQVLGLDEPDRTPPEITVTDSAAEKIRAALQGHEGIALHFQVDASWDTQFNLAPAQGGEIAAQSNGITVLMDIATAQRARGAKIDWVKSLTGEGLAIDLPAAPAPVRQMSVKELAEKFSSGQVILIDVRGAEERARASIAGTAALDEAMLDKLAQMPRDTELAFICHLGNSSRGAAEHFRKQGFTRVNNVAGGIDAWSVEIDPAVPRY